jgi:hypothetical protein
VESFEFGTMTNLYRVILKRVWRQCPATLPLLTHPLDFFVNYRLVVWNTHHHRRRPIQIFIKTLTGRKQAFNFEPENQVLAVKQALQEKEGIQVDQIRLIHSGKQLADDKTLESYNIAAGATIHMVLQLRGGGVA